MVGLITNNPEDYIPQDMPSTPISPQTSPAGSWSDIMEASLARNPAQQLGNWAYNQGQQYRDENIEPQPKLPPEDIEKKYGIKVDAPTPEYQAKYLADAKQKESAYNMAAQNASGLKSVSAGIVAGLADPINLAATLIPGVGEERVAALVGENVASTMAGRAGIRAVTGVTSGLAAGVPLSALQYGMSQSQHTDYSIADALRNTLYMGAIGGIVHPLFGAGADIIKGTPEWARQTEKQNFSTSEAAANTGVSQMAKENSINVQPIIDTSHIDQQIADVQKELVGARGVTLKDGTRVFPSDLGNSELSTANGEKVDLNQPMQKYAPYKNVVGPDGKPISPHDLLGDVNFPYKNITLPSGEPVTAQSTLFSTFEKFRDEPHVRDNLIDAVNELKGLAQENTAQGVELRQRLKDQGLDLNEKEVAKENPAEQQKQWKRLTEVLHDQKAATLQDRLTDLLTQKVQLVSKQKELITDSAKNGVMGLNEKELTTMSATAKEVGEAKPEKPEVEATKLTQQADDLEQALKTKLVPQEPKPDTKQGGFLANISVATDDKEATEAVRNLTAAAKNGDMGAHRVLQTMAYSSLQRLTSGIPSFRMEISNNTGLYGGTLEPSVGVSAKFDEADRPSALAALAKFGKIYNQEQIHVRQPIIAKMGTVYDDGSFATPSFRIYIKTPLERPEIEALIKSSGLEGLTFNDKYVEGYYAKDQTRAGIEEFKAASDRLFNAITSNVERADAGVERFWNYGRGEGTIPYESVAGDVHTAAPGASGTARAVAEHHAGEAVTPAEQAEKITPEQSTKQRNMAEEYQKLPQTDIATNPLTKRAYTEGAEEIKSQFSKLPIKVDVWEGKEEPYANSEAMRRDVQDNAHLFIFKTTPETFGPKGADFSNNPLLEKTGIKSNNGHDLVVNDMLRAVHDYYAHNLSPAEFGELGEEAAWKNRMATIKSPWARWAITSETRGQNSWVNFNKDVYDKGIARKGRDYAEQKAALLPIEDTLTGDKKVDAPVKKLMKSLTPEERNGSLTDADRADVAKTMEGRAASEAATPRPAVKPETEPATAEGEKPELNTSPDFADHDAFKQYQDMLNKGFEDLKNCLMG